MRTHEVIVRPYANGGGESLFERAIYSKGWVVEFGDKKEWYPSYDWALLEAGRKVGQEMERSPRQPSTFKVVQVCGDGRRVTTIFELK